jgi:long-chain acyl-CoA synthetase
MSELSLEDAINSGMLLAWNAERNPDSAAVVSDHGERTFAELEANVNRLGRYLRSRGIKPGDAIAVALKNRPEFVETMLTADRLGLRFTPINFHLKGSEIAYIVENCEAKIFVADSTLGEAVIEASSSSPGLMVSLSVGGEASGFDEYPAALEGLDAHRIEDPLRGSMMLYTSGTTGRPKGVHRDVSVPDEPLWEDGIWNYRAGEDRALVTGPAYHAAPLYFDIRMPLASGVGIVMMDKWDPQRTLELIERYRISHTHMVATMFHRLLDLPDAVRTGYSTDSVRFLLHGAAPCPVHVKQAMIDWFGPVVWEYYAATEGGDQYFVGSEEWLTRPGTVGRAAEAHLTRILDDKGNDVSAGEVGTIYMRAPDSGRFEYFKDSEKTADSYRGDYFTLGDLGYLDKDGYLFLTGRSAELIISGGVNVYPIEVDVELLKHPAVFDVCTVGVPNDEWGEEVKSVVRLHEGHAGDLEMEQELVAWARERLAAFKCPRGIDFVDEIPRSEAGKVQRKAIRAGYWPD